MSPQPWPFNDPPDVAVVTTDYVTRRGMPILYVSHDHDEDGSSIWQFHCGNDDYSAAVLQLVGLGEVYAIDCGIAALADLPIGSSAPPVPLLPVAISRSE